MNRFRTSSGISSDALTGLALGIAASYVLGRFIAPLLGPIGAILADKIVLVLLTIYVGGLWYRYRKVL